MIYKRKFDSSLADFLVFYFNALRNFCWTYVSEISLPQLFTVYKSPYLCLTTPRDPVCVPVMWVLASCNINTNFMALLLPASRRWEFFITICSFLFCGLLLRNTVIFSCQFSLLETLQSNDVVSLGEDYFIILLNFK